VASGSAAEATLLASARSGEPDRYLAALLAPPAARPHLVALAAFSSELARVPALVVREPAMAAIRLQWWRDAITAGPPGRTGSPVADALVGTAREYDLPAALLLEVIDGHEVNAARELLGDEAALASYLWKTEGALFALATHILGRNSDAAMATATATACGQAYGSARLLMRLPQTLSHGWVPLPLSRLDASGIGTAALLSGEGDDKLQAVLTVLCTEITHTLATSRLLVVDMPRHLRPAFLPLALVAPYLRALARPGRDPLRTPAEVAPLTRVWRIAAAHWLGRI
jgi:15-cis-phytoene synthase